MSDETNIQPEQPDTPTRGELRARSKRRRRWPIVAGVVGTLLVVAVGWYELQVHPTSREGVGWVVVKVAPGEGVSSVAGSLKTADVIDSPLAYRIYTLLHGAPGLRPGSYAFHRHASFAIVQATLSGPPNAHSFDLPAGFTLAEVAKRIRTFEPRSFVKAFRHEYETVAVKPEVAPQATTLEGKVGVGVYTVLPGESPHELLSQMVNRFDETAHSLGLNASTVVEGHDVLQVISIASIVQKEGYYPSNMPKVARVVYNRLAKDMPLQMDSTVLYSLGQDGGPVTAATLKIDTPYNTYLYKGLPPTPIATPSREALAAALKPPAGPWLYFVVVDRQGTEAFSTTYAEQLRNQELARQRGL